MNTPLRRRVFSARLWGANLLVTGVIVAVSLGFGRQVVDWWGRSPWRGGPRSYRQQSIPLALPIYFGDAEFAFKRSQFAGDRAGLMDSMRQSCRTASEEAYPSFNANASRLPPPGAAELRLAQLVADAEPAEERSGEWTMHVHDGPIPLVVVIGYPKSQPKPARRRDVRDLYLPVPRVICWGLALAGCADQPGDAQNEPSCWTTYTCAVGDVAPTTVSNPPDLPSEVSTTMALRLEGGSFVIGIEGIGTAEDWRRRFDDWYREEQGTRQGPWRQQGEIWQARYVGKEIAVDVHFVVAGEDSMTGLATTESLVAQEGGETP